MKGKKAFSTAGMIVSALIIIAGILTMSEVFGGSASYVPYLYDSGYASFGGDFYSYVNNNAALAAKNVQNLLYFATTISGIFMICIGLLGVCYFGMARSECAPRTKKAPVNEPQAWENTSAGPTAEPDAEPSAEPTEASEETL